MRRTTIAILALFVATAALASWYDDYDAGLNAARKGQWSTVIAKMSAAIAAQPKENDKARTYGAIFISYHPYYYRGIAYLNTGKFEQAIADLERAEGIGDENLGSIEINMGRAKQKLAAANAPEPQPVAPAPQPQPRVVVPAPQPVQPAAPTIDPALRQQAAAALNEAKNHLTAAQQRRASGSPQYQQAAQQFAGASTLNASAKSNDDFRQVIATAQSAASIADLATAPGAPAVAAAPLPTRPVAASTMVLGDTAKRVRLALESYFRGDFDDAAAAFERLTTEMPRNGWIYAFLGASQYSRYAFEADERYKVQAMDAFRKAKQYGKWKGGLPEKYFSRRIRRVFANAG
ncbi:MAG TPA: tetratricopeptide repeat protein [Thermoanaerobaculia bacterium]|nr:tetratricopeptide repeat protein [Thermoanaerobaculia bacterium]